MNPNNSITIKAPAKLNLILQITGKRKDGYHLLNSLMQSINIFDTIILLKKKTLNNQIKIKISYSKSLAPYIKKNFDAPCSPEKNICGRVARKIMDRYKIKNDIEIKIIKRIPIGAGLGGGSSDGAATARGLNQLFNLNLSVENLCAIVKDIGADIPFNIYGGAAVVKGIGEKIKKLSPVFSNNYGFIIIYPDIQCSTIKVYKNHKFNLTNKTDYIKFLLKSIKQDADINELEKYFVNDLSVTVSRLYKKIDIIKNKITRLTNKKVFMSGSGSTLFLIFEKSSSLNYCHKILKAELNDCLILKTTPL